MAPRGKGHKADTAQVSKPVNPKDQLAVTKLPLHVVPDSMRVYASLAFLEGALKYGSYNWRVAGVKASVYLDALDRHISKWRNGEEVDQHTGVPHLANALACIGIIVDAHVSGKLMDDRPPTQPDLAGLIDGSQTQVKKLKELFGGNNPKHYTIADSGVNV